MCKTRRIQATILIMSTLVLLISLTGCDLTSNTMSYSIVSFDGNGAESGSSPGTIIQDSNLEITLPTTYGSFYREGNYISGWNTKADGSGTAYKKGETVELTGTSLTLFAQWTHVIDQIQALLRHMLILKDNGDLFAGGSSRSYQLGFYSDYHNSTDPLLIMTDVKSVSSNDNFTLVLKNDGSLFASGTNTYGAFGDGTTTYRRFFTRITDIDNIESVYSSTYGTMIKKKDDTLWAAGKNNVGQLGIGALASTSSFVELPNMTDVSSISMSDTHTVVVKNDGTLWVTGSDSNGQLGLENSSENKTSFVQVPGVTGVASVVTSTNNTLILKTDGTVWATGQNSQGSLGFENQASSNTFQQVSGISDAISLTTNSNYSMIITGDGQLWVSGNNQNGQFGDETFTNSTTFKQTGITDVLSVSAGSTGAAIVKEDGSLWVTGSAFSKYFNSGQEPGDLVNSKPIQISLSSLRMFL